VIENVIAKRYARALIALAKEESGIDAFGEQLKSFKNLCVESDLFDTLSNSGYDISARLSIVNEILGKSDFHEHFKNFLRLLIRKGRMGLLVEINDEYVSFSHEELNRRVMTVVSAVDLSDDIYNELTQHFCEKTGKEMILRKKVDAELLGGARVHIGDQVFDYTIRKQLNDIKSQMA